MFCKCISLVSLPDISKWDINKVTDASYMFSNCSNFILSLPDFSKWNTSKITKNEYKFETFYQTKLLSDKIESYINNNVKNCNIFQISFDIIQNNI